MYHSLSDEVQTHAFVEKWHQTKKVLLPVVRGDILELRHYTGKDCLETGAFGIEEPSGPLPHEFQPWTPVTIPFAA